MANESEWICPECGENFEGDLIRCVCGYEEEQVFGVESDFFKDTENNKETKKQYRIAPSETAVCTRCHRNRAGCDYVIHLMKVTSTKWENRVVTGFGSWKQKGKNFYVPVKSIREFYCNRCSLRMLIWFYAEPLVWVVAYIGWISIALGGIRVSNSETMQAELTALLWGSKVLFFAVSLLWAFAAVTAGVALVFWMLIPLGIMLVKEVGVRLTTPRRAEIVEFRMTQRKGSHNHRKFYSDHNLGQLGEIDAFTTTERP